MSEFHPYRPCVGVALFNQYGKVFVGERIDTPGSWQMPQGGIEEGEGILAAALREMEEEIGTAKAELLEIFDRKILYDIPADILERLHKIWDKPYVGQEQVWVALRFTGNDSDIDLDTFDAPEFSQWKWESLENVPNLIVPFKQDVYRQIVQAFHKFAQ